VLWGCWHGALLIAERLGLGKLLALLPRPLAQAYAVLCVMLGWVLFRADSVPHALAYLGAMAGLHAPAAPMQAWQLDFSAAGAVALLAGWVIACVRLDGQARAARWLASRPALWGGAKPALAAAGFLLSVISLAAGTYNPFIYFRF